MPCFLYWFTFERCYHSSLLKAHCTDTPCTHSPSERRISDSQLKVTFHGKCERCVERDADAEQAARDAYYRGKREAAAARWAAAATAAVVVEDDGGDDDDEHRHRHRHEAPPAMLMDVLGFRESFERYERMQKRNAMVTEIRLARDWAGNYALGAYFLLYGLDRMRLAHEDHVAARAHDRALMQEVLDAAEERQRQRQQRRALDDDDEVGGSDQRSSDEHHDDDDDDDDDDEYDDETLAEEILQMRERLDEWDADDRGWVSRQAITETWYDHQRFVMTMLRDTTPFWVTVVVDATRTREELIAAHEWWNETRRRLSFCSVEYGYLLTSSAPEVNRSSGNGTAMTDVLLQQTGLL
ncbi:hypothetical protein JDV02_004954 [Purpureocillium takamizusanense]|uniref:Uncharacterized protein n=1 Tax=Purpureocillium takamizusanense TaxID=2060973 RepID=A0A9Q8QDF1_9HYPO|nr:uncharacterized protein JDV02_004954 [Purpureocillium takamizusanense]UNI18699.1 hypothetical protein JDV02_004954 [Purpureocillium takamizusanense]